jgi:hypothetical protein
MRQRLSGSAVAFVATLLAHAVVERPSIAAGAVLEAALVAGVVFLVLRAPGRSRTGSA